MSTRHLLVSGEITAVRHHTIKVKHKASGFTLVEVMIALAIFVIGALAIVRIFPPALNVIQGSESRSIAMNRSRAYLARSTAQPNLVPDAIYDFDPTSTGFAWRNAPVSITGTATRNRSLPTGIDEAAIEASALGRFRRVVGEKHRVLVDDSTTGSNPTDRLYVLSQFAHAEADEVPSGVTPLPGSDVDIYVEDRVTGVRVAANGLLDFTDARLVKDGRNFNQRDYDNRSATPFPRTDDGSPSDMEKRPPVEWRNDPNQFTVYYITYRWRDTEGLTLDPDERVNGVIDERMTMPIAGTDPDDFRVFMGTSPGPNKQIIEGEVGVRVKRFLTSARVSPGTLEERQGDSIRGYVPITDGRDNTTNPEIPADLRSSVTDQDTLSYSEVSLNYTVRDWRWLVDDDTPDRDGTVTTPIRFYDGETLGRLTGASALDNPQTPLYSLLTFTNEAGATRYTRPAPGKWDDGQAPEGVLSSINHKTGVLDYNTNPTILTTPPPNPSTSSFNAPRARTVYWTLDGWAQQVAVAARSYLPFMADRPDADRERWREYYWAGDQGTKAAIVGQAQRSVLYFPPSESGKTVLVTFEHEVGAGNYRTQSNVLTIEDKVVGTVPPTVAAVLGNQARRAEFRDPAVINGTYDVRAILSVQGLSVQSRTAWIESNARYTQVDAVGYRKLD